MNLKNRKNELWRVGLILLLLGTFSTAEASLIYTQSVDIHGTGIGEPHTVLIIKDQVRPLDGAASGCVTWTGTGNAFGTAACPPYPGSDGYSTPPYQIPGGEEQTPKQQTLTMALTGSDTPITRASDIMIVMDPADPGTGDAQSIVLEQLYLSIQNSAGTVLFSAYLASPFDTARAGTGGGSAGFAFQLDSTQAALAEAAAFGSNFSTDNRIGLAASVSQSSGAMEVLAIYNSRDFEGLHNPEPASLLMFGTGLLGLALFSRRFSKKPTK